MQATLDAYETTDEIWSRTYTGGSRNHNGCQHRVDAILQDIDVRGWSDIRPGFLVEVSEARTLQKDADELVTVVTNFEGPCAAHLKTECSRLLCITRLWLAAEEEILSLMDKDQEALEAALLKNALVWQHA